MAKGTVNKIILLGRLGQAPEIRQLPNGNAVANISLATNDGSVFFWFLCYVFTIHSKLDLQMSDTVRVTVEKIQ